MVLPKKLKRSVKNLHAFIAVHRSSLTSARKLVPDLLTEAVPQTCARLTLGNCLIWFDRLSWWDHLPGLARIGSSPKTSSFDQLRWLLWFTSVWLYENVSNIWKKKCANDVTGAWFLEFDFAPIIEPLCSVPYVVFRDNASLNSS